MSRKKFIVEFGMGSDLHGQDVTKASRKAVRDAISRSCLCGLSEIMGIKDFRQLFVEITIAAPLCEQVDKEAVLAEYPFGNKTIHVIPGGMSAPTLMVSQLGDRNEDAVVVLAAISVSVEV